MKTMKVGKMSNVSLDQDLWVENLADRAESFRESVGSAVDDVLQYLAHNQYEEAERLVERLENEVPLMLDGRENGTT